MTSLQAPDEKPATVLARSERLEVSVTNAFAGVVTKRRLEGAFSPAFLERLSAVQGLVHPNLTMVFTAAPTELTLEWVDGLSLAQLGEQLESRGVPGVPAPVAVLVAIELCKVVSAVQRLSPGSHPSLGADHVLLGRARGTVKWTLAGASEQPAAPDAREDVRALGQLISTCAVGVDPALASILAACVEADPERRFQSVSELQQVLQAWLTSHPYPLLVDVLRFAQSGQASPALRRWLAPFASVARARASRRSWRLASVAFLVSLALAVGLLAVQVRRWRPDTSRPVRERSMPGPRVPAQPVLAVPRVPSPPPPPPVPPMPVVEPLPTVLRDAEGPGIYSLTAAHALSLSGHQATEVLGPARGSWSVALKSTPGSLFASFFDRQGVLMQTSILEPSTPLAAPAGALTARVYALGQASFSALTVPQLEVRGGAATERVELDDFKVEARDASLEVRLIPSQVYRVVASGNEVIALLNGPRFDGVLLRRGGAPALKGGDQVLLRSGAGLTFTGASTLVLTMPAGAVAAGSARVVVTVATKAEAAALPVWPSPRYWYGPPTRSWTRP